MNIFFEGVTETIPPLALFCISKSTLTAHWKTKMLGKIDFQCVNNLVHILIMALLTPPPYHFMPATLNLAL